MCATVSADMFTVLFLPVPHNMQQNMTNLHRRTYV